MDMKNKIISICSTINIFLKNSYKIKKNFMSNKNTTRWVTTKSQIDEIIFPAYTKLTKYYFSYLRQLASPLQYITDILRNLADTIMTSYPEVKVKNSIS